MILGDTIRHRDLIDNISYGDGVTEEELQLIRDKINNNSDYLCDMIQYIYENGFDLGMQDEENNKENYNEGYEKGKEDGLKEYLTKDVDELIK